MSGGSTALTTGDDEAVSALALIGFLGRYRRLLMILGVAGGLLTGVILLLLPRTWLVDTSFLPQSRRATSSLAGLAAQLGVSVPGSDPGTSPQFYADLVRGREVLAAVAEQRYLIGSGGDSLAGTLADIWKIKGATPAMRHDAAIRKLRGAVDVSVNQKTGVVGFSVITRWPGLSLDVANALLAEVNRFNQQTRQSQASAERQFAERRVAEARDSLRAAEAQYQSFLQRNRGDLRSSPELQFASDRLSREVTLRQQIYTSLAQAHEQARIEEVRDTPVLTVLDRPEMPSRPRSRGIAFKGIAGGLFGLALGILLAVLHRSYVETRRRAPDVATAADRLMPRWLLRWIDRQLDAV